ncbi:MAG: class I SAM-dependent methyltransferase [Patescibacteria group bacterium]|jgi:ubiquinone/menaquinone biosynthesis C-methylase UbiE
MKLFHEPFFEPFARIFRFAFGSMWIPRNKELVMLDVGCGPQIRFYHFARLTGIRLKKYIGIDPLLHEDVIRKHKKSTSLVLKTTNINKTIAISDNSVDLVVGFAYLEHVDYPQEIVNEMIRVLKPGGVVILTTPTDKAKPVLEFLSYALRLISRREIEEHKRYFTKETLMSLVSKQNLRKVKISHHYFELYLNNLFIIKKHEA